MKRDLNTWLCVFTSLLLFHSSCSRNLDSTRGVWDQQTATFSIEEDKITYSLPSEISSWAIANQESIPSNMYFFGIDKAEGICIGIFSPDINNKLLKKVADYTDVDIDVIARQLTNTDNEQRIHYENIVRKKENFGDMEVWCYVVGCGLYDKSTSDTINVFYSGYIFDGLNKPYGIVMISDQNPTDSIGKTLFRKYTSTLHVKK